MPELEIKLKNMDLDFKKVQTGYCLLVKLVNYEELYAMFGSALEVVSDMNLIIRQIFDKHISSVCTHIVQSNIFVIIPTIDKDLLKKLSLEIHTLSQLYTNPKLPEAYIQIKIGIIDFYKYKKTIDEIYYLLIGLLANNRNNNYYYYEYKEEIHNLELIRESNKNLNELRKAVRDKSLRFAYQPIIDRKTLKPYYYESLLRIQDKNGDLQSVGPIIEVAETKGLIYVIDRFVFEMVIDELAKSPDVTLSVNISNIGILDDNLLEMAQDLLKKHDVSKRLIIEITESSLNEDYKRTKFFIDTLHKLGCRFALDDFGSGFTSFRQLKNLPIDIIKIDGSYVRNILSDHASQYFVEALIKISEEKGIVTVAEFVENGDIAKYLIDKVDSMQGDFFSPAVVQRKED